MKCQFCNYDNPKEDDILCPSCGGKYEKAEKQEEAEDIEIKEQNNVEPVSISPATKKGKKKSIKKIITASVACFLVVALLSTATVVYFTSPAQDVYKNMESSEFEDALTKYSKKIKDNVIHETILKISLNNYSEKIQEKFNNGEIDFAYAQSALEALGKMNIKDAEITFKAVMSHYADTTVAKYESATIDFAAATEALQLLKELGCESAEDKTNYIINSYADSTIGRFNNGEIDYGTAVDIFSELNRHGYGNNLQKINEISENMANRVVNEYENGQIDYNTAKENLNNISKNGYEKATQMLINISEKHANYIVSEYENGKIDYNTAKDNLDILSGDGCEKATQLLINISEKHANYVFSEYKNEKIDYDTAIEILEVVKENGYYQASSIISQIKAQKTADDITKKGDELFNKGNYKEAIDKYLEVDKNSADYQQIATKIETSYKKYAEEVLNAVNGYITKENYKSAVIAADNGLAIKFPENIDISAINTARAKALSLYEAEIKTQTDDLIADNDYAQAIKIADEALEFNKSQTLRDLRTSIEAKCIDSATKTVDNYMKKGDFQKALNCALSALEILPKNDKLKALKQKVIDNTPIPLSTVHVIDSSEYKYYDETLKDSYGNLYNGYHRFSTYDDCSALFNLNKSYTKFNCSIVAGPGTYSYNSLNVSIYLDDVLVYTSNNFNKLTEKQDVSISVADVSKLKIIVRGKNSSDAGFLYLVNATVK